MAKERERPLGKHVKFRRSDLAPYVEPSHLFNSENFRKTLNEALELRAARLAGDKRATAQS